LIDAALMAPACEIRAQKSGDTRLGQIGADQARAKG
jgi:hypothetical protein